jgi:hypothetical protein
MTRIEITITITTPIKKHWHKPIKPSLIRKCFLIGGGFLAYHSDQRKEESVFLFNFINKTLRRGRKSLDDFVLGATKSSKHSAGVGRALMICLIGRQIIKDVGTSNIE